MLRFLEHIHADTPARIIIILQMLLERTCFCMMRCEPNVLCELISGCKKVLSSVNRGRLYDVSRDLIDVVFAPDCPLSQAFQLDLLIASFIAWGADFVIR
jgi:hypothetical protein